MFFAMFESVFVFEVNWGMFSRLDILLFGGFFSPGFLDLFG